MGITVGRGTKPKIYAIDSEKPYTNDSIRGLPPYYRVTGLNNGEPVCQELKPGSHEYNYVKKLVGTALIIEYETSCGEKIKRGSTQRLLLGQKAKCNVSKAEVIKMLSE